MTRGDPEADALPHLPIVTGASLAGRAVPPRRWLIKDLIPDCTVTTLSGDGGVGKGLLAAQLGVAVGTGSEWVGLAPAMTGPAIHVSAEDDADEMHRRLVDIVAGSEGALSLKDLSSVHILPLAGRDAVMAATDQKGIVSPSRLWRAVEREIAAIGPKLLILENLADIFAGNEISRTEARQFVGLLRAAAVEHDLAVLLIAHPSLTGMANGSGSSGSTAWSNSVRARMYLDRVRGDGNAEPNPDLRSLTLRKANYAPTGAEIRMRYVNGRFLAEGTPSVGAFSRLAAEQKADITFLKLLAMYQGQKRDVSPNKSSSYAPTNFAQEADADGVAKKALEAAMSRLLKAGTIRVETFGPPSKQRSRLVVA